MSISPSSYAVLISGGMGDIGRAVALRLARDGHRVGVLYRHNSANEATAFIASLPGSGHAAFQCDITDSVSVHEAAAQADGALRGLQVGIHAAVSPLVRNRASIIDPASFREQFEVTTFGGLSFFQAVLPYLRARNDGGHLVGITSAALDNDSPSGMAGYLCAKFALRGLLRELRAELAPAIAVHEVAPMFVQTRLHSDLPDAVRTFIAERTPTQTPEDIAEIVAKIVFP